MNPTLVSGGAGVRLLLFPVPRPLPSLATKTLYFLDGEIPYPNDNRLGIIAHHSKAAWPCSRPPHEARGVRYEVEGNTFGGRKDGSERP